MSLRTFKVGVISIHAPRVGGDLPTNPSLSMTRYFNPRPPCGGRRRAWEPSHSYRDFNPRPPCGGRHPSRSSSGCSWEFQSTPPVWGATKDPNIGRQLITFQSTPPVWGATDAGSMSGTAQSDFNPRPPCGGRRWEPWIMRASVSISIHAPRVGGDMEKLKSKISNTISIHAPRVGGDSVRHFTLPGFHYFNPRPPCGGRQTSLNNSSRCVEFQSTPPVWGATRSW